MGFKALYQQDQYLSQDAHQQYTAAIRKRGNKILKTCPSGATTMAKGKAGATARKTARRNALKRVRRHNQLSARF